MSSYARQEQDAAKTTQFHTTIEIEKLAITNYIYSPNQKAKGKAEKD